MKNIYEKIENLLKQNSEYVAEDGNLLKNNVLEDAYNLSPKLIKLLLSNEDIKKDFFVKVDDVVVFNKDKFVSIINSKNFLPDSYTKYLNKIGLTHNNKFISKSNDVVLDFPYKDCVLAGGQTKDDQKREEIVFNELIASDEITRMLAPKVFTNAKRYTKSGIEENITFNEDDNLIIKGNNLVALSSILKRYEGKVKCIYIDPPYNTKNSTNNTFKYNNNFNHSTWLIFMKNRLEIAKRLLIANEGAIIIAIDENEQAYLGVMLDEIFSDYEIHLITVIHNPRGVQGINFSYTNEFLYFVIPKGKKIIQNRKLSKEEIEFSPLRNWGSDSLRSDAKNCFYPILVKNEQIIGFGDVCDDEIHPTTNETIDDITYIYPIDINGIERKWRYARNSVENIKHLLRIFKRKDGVLDIELGKDFGQYKTVWTDKKFDSNAYGKQWLNKLVDDKSFSFPKSIYSVKEAIYSIVSNDKEAIILDFFGGSGTSAEAVNIINKEDLGNRKFIIIEQMEYIKNITTERIINSVIKNNNINTNIVYCELKENAYTLIKLIQDATEENINQVKEQIFNDDRIIPYIRKEDLENANKDFEENTLDKKKEALITLINKNKLYVNFSDIEDEEYQISESEKKFTNSFYKGV